jgi:MFS family permease
MSAGVMVAPALGPVIGGLLARFLGWRSVFWFLVIVSGGYLLVYMIAMPETARTIVGDGRLPPKECWRMSLVQYLSSRRRERTETNGEQSEQQQRSSKLKFPNPLASFAILLEKDALIIISYVGLVMFGNIALLTSTPNLFPRLYGFNELQVGLCFLSVYS